MACLDCASFLQDIRFHISSKEKKEAFNGIVIACWSIINANLMIFNYNFCYLTI